MERFENCEDYYDDYSERRNARSWKNMLLRYCCALLALLIVMTAVLSAWWIWEDYALLGYRGITWSNFNARAEYRWQEALHGRLGLDETFCNFYTC